MRLRLLSLFAVVAACGDQPATADGGATGGTVVIVSPGTGSTPMIPPYAQDVVGRLIVDNLYDRLAEIGPELNTVSDRGFIPRLAQRWEWAADSMSIAFMLDPRARWHDGRPVRASDVAFTVNLLKDKAAATFYTNSLENVDSVSVRDSLTAVAWFRRRSPEQFYDIAQQVHVLPEHLLRDVPRPQLATSPVAQQPIGSGRFRFARFEPGVRVELVADTTHYRGRAKLDRVIISFVPDPATAATRVLNGEADFWELLPPDLIPRFDSSATARAIPYPGLQYVFLWMNQRDRRRPASPHPILSDRRVRQAIAMGVDRQGMLQNVFGNRGTLGSGPFSRALADTTVALPPFDRARAAALLDSAGWRTGADGMRSKGGVPLTLSIVFPTSSAQRRAYSVLLQEQLRTLGVRAEVEPAEITAFVDRMERGNFDLLLMGWNTDPSRSSAKQSWGTTGAPPNGQNFTRYSNRTFDALLDTAVLSFDPTRSDQYYHRAIQALVDDVPAVWLYDVLTVAGAHKRIRVEGIRADTWWAGLADWWIPAGERIDRDRIGLRPASTP